MEEVDIRQTSGGGWGAGCAGTRRGSLGLWMLWCAKENVPWGKGDMPRKEKSGVFIAVLAPLCYPAAGGVCQTASPFL